jgi:hypothetical protein
MTAAMTTLVTDCACTLFGFIVGCGVSAAFGVLLTMWFFEFLSARWLNKLKAAGTLPAEWEQEEQ